MSSAQVPSFNELLCKSNASLIRDRDCDPTHDNSSWVLLQFSESRQVILDECVSDDDNE